MDSLLSLATQACTGRAGAKTVLSECSFYHYLCDGFDDRGWGCGYRSLQSLCSWVVKYRENVASLSSPLSLVDREEARLVVPTIPRVQSCLVEVGDKPSLFAGSKEWIGCCEASIVLDHLYGVSCKILHVSSGHDVVQQCDVLAQHFESIGSPVMIGGNVDGAAKTLLAVWSGEREDEREKQFLIADPHYYKDADNVPSKVSWHSSNLFDNHSFYNFCLPQLPS